jgi:phage I-like protein
MDGGVNSTMKISLNAAAAADDDLALCSAVLMDGQDGQAPDWVHLLPAGKILTEDGRGPYTADFAKLVEAFPKGGRLIIDENHATDLAAPNGLPAPARGWIVELNARDTGLWGRVEWTDEGRQLVASKAYRAISPALQMEKGSPRVLAVLRAGLVNTPNIKRLVALNQETTMNPLLQKLLSALGLATDTSEETLVAAVTTLHQAQKDANATLQSIAGAAGFPAGEAVTTETVLNAVQKLKAAPAGDRVVAELQQQLVTVTTELNQVKGGIARQKAEAFVDNAIREARVGVKPLRDHYIERHMADPAAVEKELNALPSLAGNTVIPARKEGDADVSLNASELKIIEQLGIPKDKFLETRDGKKPATA